MLPSETATRRPRAGVRGWRRADRPTPAGSAHVGGAARTEAAAAALADRARVHVGLLAFSGLGLLLTSETVDRLERLEDNAGIGWLNLTFAAPLATIAVCAAALIGDTALRAIERRIGRRPRTRLTTPLLATSAAATISGILLAHLTRPLALDGWTGLAGSLLLLIGAIAHHHLPEQPGHAPRTTRHNDGDRG